jgi:hypothetical protein
MMGPTHLEAVMCMGNPWVFSAVPIPIPAPSRFSGQNKPQIIQNSQVLSELCLKQSN